MMGLLLLLACPPERPDYERAVRAAETLGCLEGYELGYDQGYQAGSLCDEVGDPWSWLPAEELNATRLCRELESSPEFLASCRELATISAVSCYAPAFVGVWYRMASEAGCASACP